VLIRIKRSTYLKVLEALEATKKIAAIKAVRTESGCGLREAKDAVELLMYKKGFSSIPVFSEHRIVTGPSIKRMIVDYGEGEIEVDLESMQLKALMEMQAIGLDICAEVLDLVATLSAYENGEKIGVIDEEG